MLNCPRDGREMEMVLQDGISFAYCKTCHGVWISESDVVTAMKGKNKKLKLFKLEPKKILEDDFVIKCMICENTFLQKTQKGDVTIDYCPKCKSIWFDGGELLVIAEKSNLIKEVDPLEDHIDSPTTGKIATATSSVARGGFKIIEVIGSIFQHGDLDDYDSYD